MMKLKTILFSPVFLISLLSISVSDGRTSADELPPGVIQQFKHGAAVYAVAYSPQGEFIASGGDNNVVILWNVADRKRLKTFTGPSDSVMSVAFSPDGKFLASASLDGFVRLYNVALKNRIDDFVHGGWVNSIAFSPDGKMLVSGGEVRGEAVKLWNVDASQNHLIASFPGHTNTVESVTFSFDGKYLASTSRDNTVKIWDVPNQQLQRNLTKHKNIVYSVAFSSDGQRLATSSRDYTIKLWNLSTGENIDIFKPGTDRRVQSESLAFSPDGKHLAAACSDSHIRLWNVDNHHNVTTLRGHTDAVFSVCFSSDGRQLVSGSRDRTVLLWDLAYFNIVPSAHIPDPAPNHDSTTVSIPDQVIADITPPDITILTPSGRIVPPETEELTVRGRVSDDSSIGKINVNDKEVDVEADGRYTAYIPLTGGHNEIRIIATDIHGNMGTKRIVVNRPTPIDTIPPNIVILSPTEPNVPSGTEELFIQGIVTDNDSISEVEIDGDKVRVAGDGRFAKNVKVTSGKNMIRIIVKDIQGNLDTKTLTFSMPIPFNSPPVIRILSPVYNHEREQVYGSNRGIKPIITIHDDSVNVSGEVHDDDGVSDVKVNGMKVSVRGEHFEKTVLLNYDDNPILVTATDGLGKKSEKQILVYRPRNNRAGKDHALLFAVNDYDHWPSLRNPIADAERLQRDLDNIYGFQTQLIKNPTRKKVFSVIREYAAMNYTDDSQLFIFFAGHGHFDEVFNEGHLVAQDSKLPEDDIEMLSSVSHARVREIIDRMKCKHIFLVLDTCYSGTFGRKIAMRGETEFDLEGLSEKDVERILNYNTRRYLTSGGKEQVPDNSPFVRALLEALREKGGIDNILTIEEILVYMENLDNPKPCESGFGINEPGSNFLFFAK